MGPRGGLGLALRWSRADQLRLGAHTRGRKMAARGRPEVTQRHFLQKSGNGLLRALSAWLRTRGLTGPLVSNSVRPHRRQPTRLPRPWDSPGKNTGVGCHFLLQCMKMKSESEVAQSCLTLSDPMDCSLPGSSIHGIF
ncbi:hypothetical protein K5549_020919, partial [Capra hircus]